MRSLTETEARIARLAARGKTNHEIAAALVVSPKTVEWNLTKVYRKLRVRSRTELAVAAASGRIDKKSGGSPGKTVQTSGARSSEEGGSRT